MLLSRDYVGYMAKEIVKRLTAAKMIEAKNAENLTQQVRQVMAEEVTIEDRLNDTPRPLPNRGPDDPGARSRLRAVEAVVRERAEAYDLGGLRPGASPSKSGASSG